MNKRRTVPARLACILSLPLLAACASNTSPEPYPAYIESTASCALVLGGSGMMFGNKGVDEIWFKINSAVSNGVVDSLRSRGYKIEALIIPVQSESERGSLMGKAMATHQCGRLIQVAHVKEAGTTQTMFGFDVEILRPSVSDSYRTADGRMYKFVSTYKKQYRFPFNDTSFKTLSLSGVGADIASDIDASGAIANKSISSR